MLGGMHHGGNEPKTDLGDVVLGQRGSVESPLHLTVLVELELSLQGAVAVGGSAVRLTWETRHNHNIRTRTRGSRWARGNKTSSSGTTGSRLV